MIKCKIKIFVAVWLLLIWTIRIADVNKSHRVSETEIHMQQTFDVNELSITPTESHLYTISEFQEAMGAEVETEEGDEYIVCVKFRIKNETGNALGWDEIMDGMGYGFETLTWYSAKNPFLGAKINIFSSENLENGGEADVWFATEIMKECFRKKNQGKIDENEFYYVMDLYPNPVKVKLEVREET